MKHTRIILFFVYLFFLTHLSVSCNKPTPLVETAKKKESIDPALLDAIKLRDDAIQTVTLSFRERKPIDEKTYLEMWAAVDPASKRTNLKLWGYLMAVNMGLSQEEVQEAINEEVSNEKINETWDEAIQWQLSEYSKKITKLQKQYSSPRDQKIINDLPDSLLRHEGPFVNQNRAYSLHYIIADEDNFYSRTRTLYPKIFDEYRRQKDGSWLRVDWNTLNKLVNESKLGFIFPTALDKPHVSSKDIEDVGSSFKEALETWTNLTEHPEEMNPDSFLKHCDPAMLESCKKWFVEWYHFSVLNEDDSSFTHLFTWSNIYKRKLKNIDTPTFWKDYLRYCKDHIEGKFFDEEDDYAYSNLTLQFSPQKSQHNLYERYLNSGYFSNHFVSKLFTPVIYIQIHDLVTIDENTIYVIYRKRSDGSMFGGLRREKFVKVGDQWKFRDQPMCNLFKHRFLGEKDQYDTEQKKTSTDGN